MKLLVSRINTPNILRHPHYYWVLDIHESQRIRNKRLREESYTSSVVVLQKLMFIDLGTE